MGNITGEQWQAQQDEVWGTKDPQVFSRVIERIKKQEAEVLAHVEESMRKGVGAAGIVWYVTNSILRGVDRVEYGPPAETDADCGEAGGRT